MWGLLLLFLLSSCISGNLVGEGIYLDPEPSQLLVGETVIVHIEANDVPDLAGLQLSMRFDPAVLRFLSTTEGSFLSENGGAATMLANTTDTSESGLLRDIIVFRLESGGVSGSGRIASVTFEAISSGSSNVSIETLTLGDGEGAPLPAEFVNTEVVILSPDTQPPTVSILTPQPNVTVAGNLSIEATASDDRTVAGVQFVLDGNNVGAEDIVAPYIYVLDSTQLTDGIHTVSAIARDTSQNLGTATAIPILVFNTPPEPSIEVHPIAFWSLDDGVGSNAGETIGGHTLALQGPAWTQGLWGGALSFDGTDDRGNPQADTVMSVVGQPLTYAAWIKTTSTTGSIIERGGGSYGAQLAITNGKASFSYRWGQGTSITTLTSTNNVNDNQWHHLTGTIDTNGAMTLYVDGNQAGTGTGTLIPNSPNDGLSIGSNVDLGGSSSSPLIVGNYAGLIDEIKIYVGALEAAEIANLSTLPQQQQLLPMGHWDLDETSGSIARDSSGNGNDGSIRGADRIEGIRGGALWFDGRNDYVEVSSDAAIEQDDTVSVAFWMKASSTERWARALSKRQSTGWEVLRRSRSNDLSLRVDTSADSGQYLGSFGPLFDNEWHHIAFTLDRGTYSLYTDGNLVESGQYEHGTGFANGDDLRIGARTSSSRDEWTGSLDDVRIYGDLLSAAEIHSLSE